MIAALLAAIQLSQASAPEAGPVVLYRTGETRTVASLFVDEETQAAMDAACRIEPSPQPYDLDGHYPVRSTRLRPGPVGRQSLAALAAVEKRPGMKPLFLVGDDPTSAAWLAGNARVLAEMGALGMVVSVETRDRFEALSAAAPGLPLIAASGDDVARELGITRYPVLITPDGVHQ